MHAHARAYVCLQPARVHARTLHACTCACMKPTRARVRAARSRTRARTHAWRIRGTLLAPSPRPPLPRRPKPVGSLAVSRCDDRTCVFFLSAMARALDAWEFTRAPPIHDFVNYASTCVLHDCYGVMQCCPARLARPFTTGPYLYMYIYIYT